MSETLRVLKARHNKPFMHVDGRVVEFEVKVARAFSHTIGKEPREGGRLFRWFVGGPGIVLEETTRAGVPRSAVSGMVNSEGPRSAAARDLGGGGSEGGIGDSRPATRESGSCASLRAPGSSGNTPIIRNKLNSRRKFPKVPRTARCVSVRVTGDNKKGSDRPAPPPDSSLI